MTEAEIKEKVRELASIQKDADTKHIEVMLEVGKLVNEVQALRGYNERSSAEQDVMRLLKGAGMVRCGLGYIRAGQW